LTWKINHLLVDFHSVNDRFLLPRIAAALSDTPAVFIQGPRQAGKTTLTQELLPDASERTYLTLDDAIVLGAARTDPQGFVDGLPEKVVLDEVQRAPDVFVALKRAIDRKRRPGRFVLTGSANALVLPRVSESLAGRMEVLTLLPFSQGEINERPDQFIDLCFARDFRPLNKPGESWDRLVPRLLRGGYPEAVARAGTDRRAAWFGSYLTTILQRDVRDLANIEGLADLPRLLRVLAARAASLLNYSDVARDLALPQSTLKRYWALLEATFLVSMIPAWSANLGKRMVKAPKIILGDTGFAAHLLGLDRATLAEDPTMAGRLLENFVAMELTKQLGWSETKATLHHYRTHDQQEVDFILESAAGKVVGIEAKKTASPTVDDFKGLKRLATDLGRRFHRGVLLHGGESTAAFGSNLHALPVSALWQA
jgi:predicted AAA+ superfamily ATPase